MHILLSNLLAFWQIDVHYINPIFLYVLLYYWLIIDLLHIIFRPLMIMKCKVWVKWLSSNPILKNILASMNTTVIPISQKSKQNSGPKDRKCNPYNKYFCYEVVTVTLVLVYFWYTWTFHRLSNVTTQQHYVMATLKNMKKIPFMTLSL